MTMLLLVLALGINGPIGSDSPFDDLDTSNSELCAAIERYSADGRTLRRVFDQELSPSRRDRMEAFYRDWLERLEQVDYESFGRDGQVDFHLFRDHLRAEVRALELEDSRREETAPLLPFAATIVALAEDRDRIEPVDPKATATKLDRLSDIVDSARTKLSRWPGDNPLKPSVANRAADDVEGLRGSLREWFGFFDGFDPVFSWWMRAPYRSLDEALGRYARDLRERTGRKPDDDTKVIGDPIGPEALIESLKAEKIPYTPEEILAIADREMAWCETQMRRAAAEMGFDEDWKAALEKVKTLYEEPGDQPQLVKRLAEEAIDFLEARDLVTVPPLARQAWQMRMMSPEAQLRNPFFLGGESIIVAFPTDTMSHEDKMMSLRGNNRHFARATVFHELIPGHNLQQFMNARFMTHRRPFASPFWTEGWALYWEMLLWELDFPRSPEDRVGMLFWRMHRCARITFSLRFHLEQMTPTECIDYLVDRVGHERANASAEVRRSFEGDYGPLYQAAYLLGGLQFRELRREVVESGKMTDRAFHDAVLRLGSMPVAYVRASLLDEAPPRDGLPEWRFYHLPDDDAETD